MDPKRKSAFWDFRTWGQIIRLIALSKWQIIVRQELIHMHRLCRSRRPMYGHESGWLCFHLKGVSTVTGPLKKECGVELRFIEPIREDSDAFAQYWRSGSSQRQTGKNGPKSVMKSLGCRFQSTGLLFSDRTPFFPRVKVSA